jgi:hypothetical protein
MIERYAKLANFLRERAGAPFQWGVNDCCVFAADAVLAQTGRDLAIAWRGLYDDELSAEVVLLAFGGVAKIATEALGVALPLVTTAQRGDVVLFVSGSGPALGVCVGDKFAAIRREDGVGYFSMRHAITAWRVG